MSKGADVPNLGEFVVEGFARRVAATNTHRAMSVPVLKVRRGRETYTVMFQDYTRSTPPLDRLFAIGDILEIHGLQLRDVVLTTTSGITRIRPRSTDSRLSSEDALAFLYA